MQNERINEALNDISAIRRIMGQVATHERFRLRASGSLDIALFIHACALVFSGAFLIQELGLSPFEGGHLTLTRLLTLAAGSPALSTAVVGALGIFLATMSVGLYAILWVGARKDGEQLSEYVARNFRTLSAMSFLSDLAIKFSGLAISIMAQHPEWVAPLLLLFTADYLFQGRFFVLSLGSSLVLGTLAVGLGLFSLWSGQNALTIATSAFVIVTATSFAALIKRRKTVADSGAASHE